MMAQGSGRSSQTTFVISVAAELAGMHPQTLRQYDRLGLVTPQRTKGRGRRYTQRHVELLREVQRLSQDEGINLAGIQRILDLQNQVEALRAERDNLLARLEDVENRQNRVFAADASGQVSQFRRGQRMPRPADEFPRDGGEVVVWQPWMGVRSPRPVVRAAIAASPAQSVTRSVSDAASTVGAAGRVSAGSELGARPKRTKRTIIETDGTNIRIIEG